MARIRLPILLYWLSFVVIAVGCSIAGWQIWTNRPMLRPPEPTLVAMFDEPGLRVLRFDQRHHLLTLVDGSKPAAAKPLWSIEIQGTPVHAAAPFTAGTLAMDAMMLRTELPDAIATVALADGKTVWRHELARDETWRTLLPQTAASCVLAVTESAGNLHVTCLHVHTGKPQWRHTVDGGAQCKQGMVDGEFAFLACPGWLTSVDLRSGQAATLAGALSLIASHPVAAFVSAPKPAVMVWDAAASQFVARADLNVILPAGMAGTASLLLGATLTTISSGLDDNLVFVQNASGESHLVAPPPGFNVVADQQFVYNCGTQTPRFQLLLLAAADKSDRQALALLNVQTGRLAWASQPAALTASSSFRCEHGRYIVPIYVAGVVSALWVLDATTGKTVAVQGTGNLAIPTHAMVVSEPRATHVGFNGLGKSMRWRLDDPNVATAKNVVEKQLGSLP